MTLEQLRVFVAVAERQHLTHAASALSLTPSAVSSSIKALEERFGVALFHRVGRGIEISDAGKTFLDEARRVLASSRAAESVLAELGGLRRGSLTIHASQTIANYWLPPLLVRFQDLHPSIELRVDLGNTEQVTRAVVQGSADIGLIEGALQEENLQCRVVAEDRMVVVVRPDHPWASGQKLTAAVLRTGHWVLREAGSGTRSEFEAALKVIGARRLALRIALELPSNEAVRSAVLAGPYAAAMSELVAAPYLRAGLLASANLDLPVRSFSLLRHPARLRNPAATAFEEILLQKQDWSGK
ncbi:LysR substrate-binding domain-containing protein [Pseudoduganella sp. R-34]|uniref:LysR family transcriptional regulator n=1 Tax=unclassified Pseudoduganella TaxID=2637179 RepID=UPI003CF800D6